MRPNETKTEPAAGLSLAGSASLAGWLAGSALAGSVLVSIGRNPNSGLRRKSQAGGRFSRRKKEIRAPDLFSLLPPARRPGPGQPLGERLPSWHPFHWKVSCPRGTLPLEVLEPSAGVGVADPRKEIRAERAGRPLLGGPGRGSALIGRGATAAGGGASSPPFAARRALIGGRPARGRVRGTRPGPGRGQGFASRSHLNTKPG